MALGLFICTLIWVTANYFVILLLAFVNYVIFIILFEFHDMVYFKEYKLLKYNYYLKSKIYNKIKK